MIFIDMSPDSQHCIHLRYKIYCVLRKSTHNYCSHSTNQISNYADIPGARNLILEEKAKGKKMKIRLKKMRSYCYNIYVYFKDK